MLKADFEPHNGTNGLNPELLKKNLLIFPLIPADGQTKMIGVNGSSIFVLQLSKTITIGNNRRVDPSSPVGIQIDMEKHQPGLYRIKEHISGVKINEPCSGNTGVKLLEINSPDSYICCKCGKAGLFPQRG